MNTLYIDYTHSVPRRQAKVHGGGNYTRTLLVNILRYLEDSGSICKIVVLWPKDYLPNSDVEKSIYESKRIILFQILNISDFAWLIVYNKSE